MQIIRKCKIENLFFIAFSTGQRHHLRFSKTNRRPGILPNCSSSASGVHFHVNCQSVNKKRYPYSLGFRTPHKSSEEYWVIVLWSLGKYVFPVAEGPGRRGSAWLGSVGFWRAAGVIRTMQDGSTAAAWLGSPSLGPTHSIINQPQPTDVERMVMLPAYPHTHWWWRENKVIQKKEGVGFRSELLAQMCWLVLPDSMRAVTMLISWASTHTRSFPLSLRCVYAYFVSRNFLSFSLPFDFIISFALNVLLENSVKDYLSHSSQRLAPTNLLCCVHICFHFSDHMVEYTNNVPAICAPESSTLNVQHKIFKSNGKVAEAQARV